MENEGSLPRSEVQLKIDNLNIEDIFDKHRIQRLMGIFKQRYLKELFCFVKLQFLKESSTKFYNKGWHYMSVIRHIEDNLRWKTTSDGRRPLIEDNL